MPLALKTYTTRNRTVTHDWLERHTAEVVLAHPMKLKAIAEARTKTDKIDATTLAELLRCDLLPSTHTSDDRTYHGRIIEASNKYLRWATIEAVWPAI